MHWVGDFPVDGPNTLGGLIVEQLEMIPSCPVGLRISGYPVEVIDIKNNTIQTIRVFPHLRVVTQDAQDHGAR